MSVAIAVFLVALGFAVLLLVVAAAGLSLATQKPHYARLRSQWTAALAILLSVATIHVIALELVTGAAGDRGVMHGLALGLALAPYAYAVGGCVAVGLAAAGAYARGLLRFPDDYVARSGFRVGAVLAFIGLVGLPLGFGVSLATVGLAVLVAVAGLIAVSWLSGRYAREPGWLLRLFVAASPLGVLALAAVGVLGPSVPLATAAPGAVVVVDALLVIFAAALFLHLTKQSPDVRSLGARIEDAARAGRVPAPGSPTMEVPRHAGR